MRETANQQTTRSLDGSKMGAKTALRLGDDRQASFSNGFITLNLLRSSPNGYSSALSTNVRIPPLVYKPAILLRVSCGDSSQSGKFREDISRYSRC